jgi:hypothetical protein
VKYSRTQPSAEGWDPTEIPVFKPAPSRKPVPPAPPAAPAAPAHDLTAQASSWVSGGKFQAASEADQSADCNSLASEDEDDPEPKPAVGSKGYVRPSAKVPPAVHRNENGEEELTCGLCGKLSTDFANYKSFRMHLAWCYRRHTQGKTPASQLAGDGGTQSGSNVVEWDAQASRKRKTFATDTESAKRQRASGDPAFSQQISPEALKDTFIVSADSYPVGYHYDTCEVCHEHGDVILCDACPCTYHLRCTGLFETPADKWYCGKCVESGASNGEVLAEEKKNDPAVADSWVLVYSSTLHRWRKAVVLAVHPERRGILLVKWWRSDNKGGKSNWVDVAKAKVLVANPERMSTAPSRSRNSNSTSVKPQASVAAVAGSRERAQIVRFDPTVERKPGSARFREGQHSAMMHMDGENGGAVPPLVRAAAAGVGGVGALRDDDYTEAKSTNISGAGMSDTYISSNSLKAALCAAGSACRAVDIAICNDNTNVFACTRPPGHHAGRYGCTSGCLSTGFCMLNNAAIAAIYARVRWGLERVAVVDIDVHFGNGTAELLRNDPNAFFASVHMIYGEDNDGLKTESAKRIKSDKTDEAGNTKKPRAAESLGFYPARMGLTEVTDTYVSVGVYPTSDGLRSRAGEVGARRRKKVIVTYDSDSSAEPEAETEAVMEEDEEAMQEVDAVEGATEGGVDVESALPQSPSKARPRKSASTASLCSTAEPGRRRFVGAAGFLAALQDVIIPQMEKFNPQLLVISGGCQLPQFLSMHSLFYTVSFSWLRWLRVGSSGWTAVPLFGGL